MHVIVLHFYVEHGQVEVRDDPVRVGKVAAAVPGPRRVRRLRVVHRGGRGREADGDDGLAAVLGDLGRECAR